MSPHFCKKDAIKIVVKNSLIMLEVQTLEHLSKKLPIFIGKIPQIIHSNIEVDFEKYK
jgi:hypothetical protein